MQAAFASPLAVLHAPLRCAPSVCAPRMAVTAAAQGASSRRRVRRRRVAASLAAAARVRKDGQVESVDAPPQALDALRALGLSVDQVRRAVRRRPTLLRLRVEEIADVSGYLRAHPLGMSTAQVRSAVLFAPQLLEMKPDDVFNERVRFLLEVALIPQAALARVVAKRPHVLWMDLDAARRVVETVEAACPLLAEDGLGSVLSRVPHAMLASPVTVADNLEYVTSLVKSSAPMARIVSKVPLVLVYSRKTFTARLDALRSVGVAEDVTGRVLIAMPEILQWSVEQKLIPAVKDLAGLVGEDTVPEVFRKLPAILAAVPGFDQRVEWLRETVGLSDAEMKRVLRAAPAILTYSLTTNLGPKWAFVHNTMGATREDILAAPRAVLCANLQQRAMPRYAFAMTTEPERAPDIPVRALLKGSDAEFCKKVIRCDPADYRSFVEDDRFLFFYSQLI